MSVQLFPTGRRIWRKVAGSAAFLLFLPVSGAMAADMQITMPGFAASVPVVSMKEARFKSVVRQAYDFSCGSAAIATLLTHHYNHPIGEEQVFQAMFQAGNQQLIKERGFSLSDMKSYLARLGYKAEGFRIDFDQMAEAGVPAITLINTKGYSHFVVIKGIKDGKVLVADPALGVKAMGLDEFRSYWKGIFFFIPTDPDTPRSVRFNHDEDWRLYARAPLDTAIDRSGLATFSFGLPGRNEF